MTGTGPNGAFATDEGRRRGSVAHGAASAGARAEREHRSGSRGPPPAYPVAGRGLAAIGRPAGPAPAGDVGRQAPRLRLGPCGRALDVLANGVVVGHGLGPRYPTSRSASHPET